MCLYLSLYISFLLFGHFFIKCSNNKKEIYNDNSNMTSFKRFESKPVVEIILIYDRLNLWRHRQFITIFYQFLHIRIEIIHGSHMYILFSPRVGLYVSFLPLAYARGKTSWHKGLPVVKTIYTYGFHELFLKYRHTRDRLFGLVRLAWFTSEILILNYMHEKLSKTASNNYQVLF